jgi:hypothetical protein
MMQDTQHVLQGSLKHSSDSAYCGQVIVTCVIRTVTRNNKFERLDLDEKKKDPMIINNK